MKVVKLCKVYNEGKENENKALNGIDLEFDSKGMVFIVGKSGSGKSTLLNILAGLDSPTSGDVYDGDVLISALSKEELNQYRRNNIGFIFQNYSLINEISVKDNVLLGIKENEHVLKEMRRMLKLLGLDRVENKIAGQLSGGQQQRVAIARAIVKESRIILGDEPTGNLDQENGEIVFEALKEISKDRLVIVITHDMESAEKYGDRIITILDGQVGNDSCMCRKEKACGVTINELKNISLSIKDAVKNARRLIKKSKLRLVINSCITVILFALFGLCLIFNQFDFEKTSAQILIDNQEPYVSVHKGYVDKKTKSFECAVRAIDKENMNKFVNDNGLDNTDYQYLLIGMFFSSGDSGNRFLMGNVNNAIVSSEKNIKKYGFSLDKGHYPQRSNEICVTDYFLYNMYTIAPYLISDKLGWKNLDSLDDCDKLRKALEKIDSNCLSDIWGTDWKTTLKNDDALMIIQDNPGLLLIGSEVEFSEGKFKITGCLNTEFDKKYKDLIYMSEEELINDPRTDTFSFLVNTVYCSFFVNEDFVKAPYKDLIIFNNAAVCKYSKYRDLLDLERELKKNQVYVSSNYFRNYFKEEFDSKKIGTYSIPNTTTMTLGEGMEPDIIYRSDDLEVVGIFDVPGDYQEMFSSSMAMIVSDDYFDEYAKSQCYIDGVYFEIPNEREQLTSLLENMEKDDYYYALPYSYSLYETRDIMNIFKKISAVLFVVIVAISAVLISNAFSALINDQRVNIGIMRAMGMNVKFILKLYISGILGYMLVIPVASGLLMLVLNKTANSIIVDSLVNYFNESMIQNIHILNLSAVPIVTIIVMTIGIVLISVFSAVCKLIKIDPIKIIRS